MIKSAASVTEMICHYTIFEELYLQSISLATDELAPHVIEGRYIKTVEALNESRQNEISELMTSIQSLPAFASANKAIRRIKSSSFCPESPEGYSLWKLLVKCNT